MSTAESESPDVVLIGAGIMSATLGSVLKELEPALDVVMFETLQDCAQESSQAWNNAGTGHAANCELDVAKEDWGLAEYLIGQVLQTGSHQLKVLEQFYPEAQRQDWREAVAGQRVQIIKPGPHHSGSLEFGTEVVGSTDNSIVALLGASPGASTAAYIAFETLEKCFAKERAGAGAEAELGSAEMLRELELLVMRGPPQLRFVLVTRHDLRLGLHRLRLAGELTEIRATDLQFTLDEARGLFDAAGVQLPGPALALLLERTEGWAAGLRLAALSLAGHPDPERFAAEFSGGERTVAEYLLAEVLERQPEQAVAMGVLVAKDSGA